jgi:hypothetical protein
MTNSCLWIDRSLRGEAGTPDVLEVMISPESHAYCMGLFMGAIHGFDSTSDEKSVSFTETRKCFPRFVAQCSAL